MKILGIETSCDETSASIVENGTKIISNAVFSSQKMHAKTGGIIPENAARQQIKSIIPVLEQSIKNTYFDAIAVTVGPGLIGSLLVGVETARTLSFVYKKPIIPVNHLVAHVFANFIEKTELPKFPYICLVVSGGHTDLILMKNLKSIKYLGGTRDDAAGEAFDKTARLLGLPYPGGPSISLKAKEYSDSNLTLFPRPMIHDKNFEFSFSGLKTSVFRKVKDLKMTNSLQSKFAAEVQEAIVDVLISKTLSALDKYKPKSLLLAGGVSANQRLRYKLTKEIQGKKVKVDLFFPEPKYCTDNAAVIASCAFFNKKYIPWEKIKVNPELTIMDKV
ncbi:tRNA (adenosine(37)-N6)-threonylcarbamoyltransferase complex transferase subunit TsaD [Patescibacteria group bacterium]|nr:tRNA (adenosine(37)-N6)-threonylcarbamoyltransferase complex transferase subunit TsaD [Patescibacteria group bacterium]MBU2035973.1 tRNA (adenosine(37)-N6)-threonylcarbamoyltransferase complex transferase subunit TsaD [Patescibacteria group bacterium]